MKFAVGDKFAFGDNYVVDNDVLITLMRYHPPDKPAYHAIWDEIESLIKKEKYLFHNSSI